MNKYEIGMQSLSNLTRKAYIKDFEDFEHFIQACNKKMDKLDEICIIKYIEYLETRYQNSTINRKLSAVNKIINLKIAENELKYNPIIGLKNYKKLRHPINYSIMQNLKLEDIKKVISCQNKTSILILFLANSGLRISELINIKNTDIKSFRNKYVKIRIIGKRKKERYIIIKKSLLNKIKKYYPENSIFLIYNKKGQKLDRTYLYRKIKNEFKKYGIDAHPHQLRHFFATYKIIDEKKPLKAISKYLGHSTTAITNDMYVESELKYNEVNII